MRFDGKSFFNTLVGFTPNWDYQPTNAGHGDSPGVNICEKIINLSKIDKNPLKSDVMDGSVVNRIREPKLLSFVLDKPPGYKVVCEPETIHHKNSKISVLNIITFCLENDNHKEVDFNQGTLNFTRQLVKI